MKTLLYIVLITMVIAYKTNPSLDEFKNEVRINAPGAVLFNAGIDWLSSGIATIGLCRKSHLFFSTYYTSLDVKISKLNLYPVKTLVAIGYFGNIYFLSNEERERLEKEQIGDPDECTSLSIKNEYSSR